MLYSVECPYCLCENDMSDGLTDLPNDNKFDHECEKCEQEFEVFVKFEPSYSSAKIEYVKCEKCSEESRDIYYKGNIYPYPENLSETTICRLCYLKAMSEQHSKYNTNVKEQEI